MKKKYAFTLLEIMIACVLAGILLAFLFTYFRQTLVRKQQLHSIKERVMQVELVRLRLTHLFDRVATEQGKIYLAPHEEAEGRALLLYGDQGVDPEVAFSGPGYAMLYKTRDKRLALCRWDKEKKHKRVDTLLKKVEKLSFSFFVDGLWKEKWPKKKDPLMVKVTFEIQGEDNLEQVFIFSLSAPEKLSVNLSQ